MNPPPRILIADDDASILFVLDKILVAEGYEVSRAANGDEAVRLARGLRYDLFLIDLIMPHKDGIETILSLRASHRKVPVIAMSGGMGDGDRSCLPLAGTLGACRTLAKPFDREALLGAIRSALRMPPMAVAS